MALGPRRQVHTGDRLYSQREQRRYLVEVVAVEVDHYKRGHTRIAGGREWRSRLVATVRVVEN